MNDRKELEAQKKRKDFEQDLNMQSNNAPSFVVKEDQLEGK
jgi:hypothetical protein